jgi:hypothetical protein
LVSTDGGLDWQAAKFENGTPAAGIQSISCSTPTVCYGVGPGVNTNGAFAFSVTTTDGGEIWTSMGDPINAGTSDSLYGVSCVSATECVAVGLDGAGGAASAAITTNGGEGQATPGGWHAQNVAVGLPLLSVSCPTTTMCLAAGGTFARMQGIVLNG